MAGYFGGGGSNAAGMSPSFFGGEGGGSYGGGAVGPGFDAYSPGSFGGPPGGGFNAYYNTAYPDQASRAFGAQSTGATTNLIGGSQGGFDWASFLGGLGGKTGKKDDGAGFSSIPQAPSVAGLRPRVSGGRAGGPGIDAFTLRGLLQLLPLFGAGR